MDTELKRQHQEHWPTRPHLHKEMGEGTLLPWSTLPPPSPPQADQRMGSKTEGEPRHMGPELSSM